MTTKLEQVRALFVPGEQVRCVANTYHDRFIDHVWTVESVGKSVWQPAGDRTFRGTFPTRAGDVLHVDEDSATWRIGRDDHTVTYAREVRKREWPLSPSNDCTCLLEGFAGFAIDSHCPDHGIQVLGPREP